MNKFYKVALGVALATLLVACNDNKTDADASKTAANTEVNATQNQEVAVYEVEQPGVKIKMTIVGEGDKVIKQITNSTIEYSAIGAANAEEAKKILTELTNNTDYSSIKGISYEMKYGPTSAEENITVDLSKADLSELAALPGSAINGDPNQGVSFKATGELLENSGFKKQQ